MSFEAIHSFSAANVSADFCRHLSTALFLAQGSDDAAMAPVRARTTPATEWFILIGALVLVSLAILIGAAIGRKRRRRHRHHKRSSESEAVARESETKHHHHRRRRRRHSHQHYPMNPTLSETGGLPPPRPDDVPPPSPVRRSSAE